MADPVWRRNAWPCAPVVIFDVGGNQYRIIAALHYDRGICYVLRVLTRQQYDTDHWKREL